MIDPTFCGSIFFTVRLLAIKDFTIFYLNLSAVGKYHLCTILLKQLFVIVELTIFVDYAFNNTIPWSDFPIPQISTDLLRKQ